MKYWLIILRTALGGSSSNINKLMVNAIPTYYFLLIRNLGMILIMLLIGRTKLMDEIRMMFKEKELLKWVILSGVFSGIGSLFYYKALNELPVSVISVLDNVFNLIFVTLIAVVFFKEKKTKKFYILFALFIPAIYLVMFKDVVFDTTLSLIGIAALAVSGFIMALDIHITRKQVEEVSVSAVVLSKALISMVIAGMCIFIFDNDWRDLVAGFSVSIAFLLIYGIFNTYLIKMIQTMAIKELGPVKTTVFLMLTPVFSILFAMLIFGEVLTITQWLGVLMIITILYFIKDA